MSKIFTGEVVSDKMAKTVVVLIKRKSQRNSGLDDEKI